MVEFGDELIIQSYKIPWLIWIQLLVMVLLFIVLFFGISLLSPDSPSSSDEIAASPSADRGSAAQPIHLTVSTSSHNIVKVHCQEEDESVRTEAGTTETSSSEANDASGDEPSLKNSMFMRFFRHPNHPCNYIGLVKQAFLKCFGVDSSSENSTNYQHQKQD